LAVDPGTLLLGVDGGGTHTRAVVADGSGRVLGRGDAGASNQATTGSAAAGRSIQAAALQALGRARLRAGDIVAACFGLAGLDHPRDEEVFRAAIAPLGLSGSVSLVNDSVIAWAGATGGAPGIAVIAGTGSVAYGRNAAGDGARAGGWGGALGDEGSAYRIAATAVNRVLRGVDGRDAPTGLGTVLASAAGVHDIADLCLLARADRAADEPVEAVVARLAPAVSAAAAAGQPEAVAIIEEAGRELAALAVAIARRLDMPAPSVHGLGSVLLSEGSAAAAVDRHLNAQLGVGLRPPRHSALTGALVLASQAAGGMAPGAAVALWDEAR
jgi:N-acetylglucosamine kinase-like BadF-type ATPase